MNGQPIWLTVLLALLGAGSLVGGIGSIWGAKWSASLGVKANERQARAEEATAEDRLIGRWERVAESEAAGRREAEEEAETLRQAFNREREYSEILRRHIWENKGWPPPSRPPKEG